MFQRILFLSGQPSGGVWKVQCNWQIKGKGKTFSSNQSINSENDISLLAAAFPKNCGLVFTSFPLKTKTKQSQTHYLDITII